MVIESLHAHVAVIAMSGAGWSEYVAGVTELDLMWMCLNSAGVEDGLVVADGPVEIGGPNGDFLELRVLIVAEDLGDDAGVDPG
jgi:hypothetical protein